MPKKAKNILEEDEESQMRGEGWKRAITLKWIGVQEDGQVYVTEIDFFADRLPCKVREGGVTGPQCGVDHTWVRILNGKIFWSCYLHQIVNGPISHSAGYLHARYAIPPMKALEICRETHQDVPPRLANLVQESRSRAHRTRRRPSDVE